MISTLAEVPQETQNWQSSSVQTFFSACNWEDQPTTAQTVAILEQAVAIAPFTELSFDLNVQQFFAAVKWDGAEIPTTLPTFPTLEDFDAPSNELTLTDLSDLF